MRAYLRRQFVYDAWANRAALAACRDAGDRLPAITRQRIAHIAAAHRLWQARLHEEASPVPVWPDWDLRQIDEQLEAAAQGWMALLDERTDEYLDATIAYTNSKGDRYESRAADVLSHVLLHAAYHRGQIASDLRAAGAEPAYTDFIHAARTGQV